MRVGATPAQTESKPLKKKTAPSMKAGDPRRENKSGMNDVAFPSYVRSRLLQRRV